ncbi:MAG TPA: glutathione peroxidase [Chitinophagaceae bacterium]
MTAVKKYLRLRRLVVLLLLVITAGWIYVEAVNRNTRNMNVRQKLLKAVYPAIIAWGKLSGQKSKVLTNSQNIKPMQSFHDLVIQLNNGEQLKLESVRGKKVLLVNTASECAFTGQYDDLQKLYDQYKDKLVIIGFPANDFKEQERGSDEQIAEFCRVNFGVTFPLAKKSTVINGVNQNEIFQWLTNKSRNGWNAQYPTWNFSKYLVDEKGVLTHYFDPAVSPLSPEIVDAVQKQ